MCHHMCVCVLGQGTLAEQKVKQLFKMARQCLDRGEDIFNTARKEQRPLALFRLATPSPVASPTLSAPPTAALSQTTGPAAPSSVTTVQSNTSGNSTIVRSRASTVTGGSYRSTLAPSQSPRMPAKRTSLPHRESQPIISSTRRKTLAGGKAPSGGKIPPGTVTVNVSGQSKAANWMAAKRAQLSSIPGLLSRKDGVDVVDGAQNPSSGINTGQGAVGSGGGSQAGGSCQAQSQ